MPIAHRLENADHSASSRAIGTSMMRKLMQIWETRRWVAGHHATHSAVWYDRIEILGRVVGFIEGDEAEIDRLSKR